MSQHHTQYGDLPLYIGGEACPSASDEWIEVTNPADQSLLARVPKLAQLLLAPYFLGRRAQPEAFLPLLDLPMAMNHQPWPARLLQCHFLPALRRRRPQSMRQHASLRFAHTDEPDRAA